MDEDQNRPEPVVAIDELIETPIAEEVEPAAVSANDAQLQAVLEAIVYVTEEPLTVAQLATALSAPPARIE